MASNNFTCRKRTIRALPTPPAVVAVPPSFVSGPSISGTSVIGSVFTLVFTAAGTPVPTALISWLVNGVVIPGETGSTFNSIGQPVGAVVTSSVTLTNGSGPAVTVTTNSVTLTPVPVAPAFASGPTISGPSTVGGLLTVAHTQTGFPVPTVVYQWRDNGTAIPAATASSYTSTTAGQLLACDVTLTNGVGGPVIATSNVISVTALSTVIPQTATFGAMNFPSEGGWRPQLADGRVENIANYVNLQSGSLGVYTPTIVAPGKLAFTGANGAPNGAVLRVLGASGRSYDVTVVQEANRRDLSDDIDVNRNRTVANHVGKRVVVRQNAQLSKMTRLVAAQSFMTCANNATTMSGLNAPTAFEGEGPNTFADEYHLYSYRATPVSEFTLKNMRFADQKTDTSILLEASSTIKPFNITVSGNRCFIAYDVDGPDADWSAGFPSTGFAYHRHLYVTGSGYISNLEVLDNEWRGGYIQVEIIASGYNDFSGNRLLDTYGDFRKHNTSRRHGTDAVSFTGANYVSLNVSFSANEVPATVPHPDAFQVTSGDGGNLVTHSEYNVFYHATDLPLQTLFHADRQTIQTGGHNWIMHGDFFVTRTTHAATNDWPDNIDLNRLMIVPSNSMVFPQSSTLNLIKFGSAKLNDGNAIGPNVITNSTSNGYNVRPEITATMNLTTPGYIDTGTWTSVDFGNNLARWGDWPTMPSETTFADAMSFSEAVPASPFENVTPFGQFTPGAVLQSDYTIPGTSVFANNPALVGLTVTNNTNGAFTVEPNLPYTATVFWNITSAAVTDARTIQRGVVGKTGVFAWGIKNRVGATGLLTGQGAPATLLAGNYVLNIARFDGRKKTMVENIAFTAP